MQIEKFTLKGQEALQEAKAIAERKNHQQIDVEHLLLALLGQKDGIVVPILQKLGANPEAIAAQLKQELDRVPKVTGGGVGQVYISTDSGLNNISPPPIMGSCLYIGGGRRVRIDRWYEQ
jgi:ATP-dependent Clp protease ATP-binding subunit ClpB